MDIVIIKRDICVRRKRALGFMKMHLRTLGPCFSVFIEYLLRSVNSPKSNYWLKEILKIILFKFP